MKRNTLIVILILLVFFVVSYLTNILGALNPKVSESFTLSDTMAGFLPFAFFIAYGVMSIPSGIVVELWGEKRLMMVAFGLAFLGTVVFALFPRFNVFVISLFTIGGAMATLQVVVNPLLRVAGGEEHYSFNSVLAQLVFGLASFISPQMYTYFVSNIEKGNTNDPIINVVSAIVPTGMSWVSVYWAFAVICLLMIVVVALIRFPKVELKEDEKVGARSTFGELLGNRYVILYFIGIFTYVGTEQGISYWMSKFLSQYHGYDPDSVGADAVSYFWGLMTVGGMVGLILFKLFDTKLVLRWFTIAAMLSVAIGLFGTGEIALWAFPVSGFFLSVMYPSVISLGLNSVSKHHGSFAGILMSGITGGAVVQILIGFTSDLISLKVGMFFLFITLAYILSMSYWARPIVTNATVNSLKDIFK